MADDYAFAAGFNVALASLNNAVNHLGSRNRITANGKLEPVTIRSSLIDPFPVRSGDQSGGESGDGFIVQDWFLTLAVYGLSFLTATYFANETVTQAAWTVYTRRHTYGDFARYNCYAILPSAARGDITSLRDSSFNGVFRVRLQLRDLIAI